MNPVTRRIRILVFGLMILQGVILGRVFVMQIIQGAHWDEKADSQKYRHRRLIPRRGAILDRAGRVLASEESGFRLVPRVRRRKGKVTRYDGRVWRCRRCLRTATLSAEIEPVQCRGCGAPGSAFAELTLPRPDRYAEIARQMETTPEAVETLIETSIADCSKRMKKGSLRGPNPIFKDIPIELARWLHLHPEVCPDLVVEGARLRYNHHPNVMPHLVGTAGAARKDKPSDTHPEGYVLIDDPARLAPLGFNLYDTFRMNVGHSGLEKILDARLVGRIGIQDVILDHAGVVVHTTRDDPPTRGEDVRLTIDLELQREAERILDGCGRPAAFVAMDPRTGEILVLASAPRFNVETLGRDYPEILKNEQDPLVNRPVKTAALPGSVFKVVTAIAGLEEGLIDPTRTVHCTGAFRRGRKPIGCNRTHGDVDLIGALTKSCNVYFIEMGELMGAKVLEEACRELGLGAPSGLQVAEASGSIPTVRTCGGRNGLPALRMVSFGQGRISTTPVQMTRIAALVANGGRLVHPSLIVGERPPPGAPIVSRRTIELVREGMYGVVHRPGGTARRYGLQAFDAAAKTGTAERGKAGSGALNNGWMIGFAPFHDPTVAFACYVEKTPLGGGEACGPLVAEWLAVWKRWREAGGR